MTNIVQIHKIHKIHKIVVVQAGYRVLLEPEDDGIETLSPLSFHRLRNHPYCKIRGLECKLMDNGHWKTVPKWKCKDRSHTTIWAGSSEKVPLNMR